MVPFRSFLLLLCNLFSFTLFAQSSYYTSDIDIPREGWNKVLCMQNGGTVLLHFENDKAITVVTYDSSRNRLAEQKHLCRHLDVYILKLATFKGLYEVGGEAVLFMEQERMSRTRLIRLRFNAATAALIDETILTDEKSMNQRTINQVIKGKDDEGYAILHSVDVSQFRRCDIHVVYYNSAHVMTKDVPLAPDRKEHDYLDVLGAQSQPNGIVVPVLLSKMASNATLHSDWIGDKAPVYEHIVDVYYLPKEGGPVRHTLIDFSTDLVPYLSTYTFNPFAGKLNVHALSYIGYRYKFGTSLQWGDIMNNVFLAIDTGSMKTAFAIIKHKMATAAWRKADSTRSYGGIPLMTMTNDNGLTTMVSCAFSREYTATNTRNYHNNYLQHITVTQLDDDGNELYGVMLPLSQCVRTIDGTFSPDMFCKRQTELPMQRNHPEQAYQRQFTAFNAYMRKRELYIVFNDVKENFENNTGGQGDTVHDFSATEAFYYKMDRKRVISKHYLFDAPENDAYRSCFIESADFDEQRGVYASLVQYRKGKDITLHMAWKKLD